MKSQLDNMLKITPLAFALLVAGCGSEHGGGDPVKGYDPNSPALKEAPVDDSEPEITASIWEIISGNPDFSQFVRIMDKSDTAEQLAKGEELTLFVPTDIAFDRLGAGPAEALQDPQLKDALVKSLNVHVVKGAYDTETLKKMVKEASGRAELTSISGIKLMVTLENDNLQLADSKGHLANLNLSDVKAGNGYVHSVSAVMADLDQ